VSWLVMMARAIKFEGMIRDGVMKDSAELSRLGKVPRERISQIMALTTLAPGIQETALHLLRVVQGREPVKLAGLLSERQDRFVSGAAEGGGGPTQLL
jgi:hypothetical protein